LLQAIARDALGMSTAQLARRLEVSQPRIVELEQTEARGSAHGVCKVTDRE
jgi:transcriptional regulator with XRE-family HTH domain